MSDTTNGTQDHDTKSKQLTLGGGRGDAALRATGEGEHPNFFKPVAALISSIPAALEGQGLNGGAPRYVRIARLRDYLIPVAAKDEKLAGAMAKGVGFFIKGMAYVLKYALKLEDLLKQGDAGKALVETALAFAHKVTEPEFLNTIEDLNNNLLDGPNLQLAQQMAPVGAIIDDVEKYISYIPEPVDLEVIGQQLYKMLVIEWTAAPAAAADKAAETAPVDMVKTGKLRLLLWALNKPFEPLDPGVSPDVAGIKTLGQRRLWLPDAPADKLPGSSVGNWKGQEPGSEAEKIFETKFTDKSTEGDIRELQDLLKAYGYPLEGVTVGTFDAATKKGVKQFQTMNKLTVNGELDLATVNQLFHLRYDVDQAKGGLRKAKRYDVKVKDVV